MKRAFLTVACLVALAGAAPAQSASVSFDALVDFDTTIKEFSLAVETGTAPKADRFVLLVGTVGSVFKNPGGVSSYSVELITGEWIGTAEVRTYRLFLEYSGEDFSSYFDRKSGLAKPGSRILAVGRFSKIGPGPDGTAVAWLKGFKVKVVD
ncbi:MAG: hypothetical protein NT080_03165 [Spirochaetes bacterium]|nr:hypothetical protein [Spirochaetota bacterium]